MAFDRQQWGFLPERYFQDWREPFVSAALGAIGDGSSVLDIGGGASASLAPSDRPRLSEYVGLDVEATEMERSAPGSYDETIVCEIEDPDPSLLGRFDLALSWQVLEHVGSMELALEGARACLCDGGTFVAQFTGGRAWFALLNRIVPDRLAEAGMQRLLGREPDSVFHANYSASIASELEPLLAAWSSFELVPRYRGASYLKFSRTMTRLYVAGIEEPLVRGEKRDWATHYLLVAVK